MPDKVREPTRAPLRPEWLLEWQDYPHGPLVNSQARQLNKYCVELETELAKTREELAVFRSKLKEAESWEDLNGD